MDCQDGAATSMIRFDPVPEPPEFDQNARQKGNAWLSRNVDSAKRLPDYWSTFKPALADGFGGLCGYTAMYEPVGTVDHYLSRKQRRDMIYEWSNYRFASGWINSSKQELDTQVLDPFEVEDDWFELQLPDLQLVLTDRVPPEIYERAAFTLERLHLRDDERVIRQRRAWYELFLEGEITLVGLERKAPLLARAIRKTSGI
jgi:hypothetical protein